MNERTVYYRGWQPGKKIYHYTAVDDPGSKTRFKPLRDNNIKKHNPGSWRAPLRVCVYTRAFTRRARRRHSNTVYGIHIHTGVNHTPKFSPGGLSHEWMNRFLPFIYTTEEERLHDYQKTRKKEIYYCGGFSPLSFFRVSTRGSKSVTNQSAPFRTGSRTVTPPYPMNASAGGFACVRATIKKKKKSHTHTHTQIWGGGDLAIPFAFLTVCIDQCARGAARYKIGQKNV